MLLTLLIVLVLVIVLDVAAMRWGMNSTDNLGSCEWERRWNSAASQGKHGSSSGEKRPFSVN